MHLRNTAFLALAFVATACTRVEETAAGVSPARHPSVEEILSRDFDAVPIEHRYFTVLDAAEELWSMLDAQTGTNAEYAVLAAARFHARLARGFDTKDTNSTPHMQSPRPQNAIGGAGVRPVMVSERDAKAFAEAERAREALAEYKKQVAHFLAHYPNGIDSQHMKNLYDRIPAARKPDVLAEITRLIGRVPNWH